MTIFLCHFDRSGEISEMVRGVEVLEVVPILLAGEAGAGFGDAFEFTVAHDLGIRIVDLQGAEECN